MDHYKSLGFKIAIDDFGAGYAGLNHLAQIEAEFVKLDMALIRDIQHKPKNQIILRGIVQVCNELGTTVIAEGVESKNELDVLQEMGIDIFQGYYFAKPGFKKYPEIENL